MIRQLAVLGGGQQRAATPHRGDSEGERASMHGVWGPVSEQLWPAWNGMLDAEARVYELFGEELGQKLLVLWAVSRFGESDLSHGMLSELVDDSGCPKFGDWLVEDMLLAAFALGASWQATAAAAGTHQVTAADRPTVVATAAPTPRRRTAAARH